MDKVHKQWQSSDLDIQYRFQSMLFPRGLVYDSINHQFGTSEISDLYRYVAKKKTAEAVKNSNLVAVVHSNWNVIFEELNRWTQLFKVTSSASNTV